MIHVVGDVVFGFAATAVALTGFLGWTWRELRRVDRVGDRDDDRD